jgi:tetratricopeptide (TPR) repeat protein
MKLSVARFDERSMSFGRRSLGTARWGMVFLALTLAASAAWAGQAGQAAAAKPQQAKRPPLELLQNAHALFLQKDYEAARGYYLEVLPSFPKNIDVLKNLAFCFYRRGPKGYAAAATYYSRALELSPDSLDIAESLARCLTGLKRNAEAGAIYEKLAKRPNAPPIAWKQAAEAYADADRYRQAESAYDAYLQRNPGDLAARTRLGDLYTREKNYPRAQEQYRLVLSSNPNYSTASIGMGRLSSWQGQHEEALKYFDRVLRLSPNNGDALTARAFTLLWSDRPEEARALFQKLQKRYPRSSEISHGLDLADGELRQRELVAARRAGDTARIEAYYRDRLTVNANDTSALKALAEVTATPERCSESISLSRRGLEILPNDQGFESRLTRALVLCQQYAESITHYNRILESDPNSEGALTGLGSTLLRARRNPEAIDAFRKALQINPQNSDAKLGLALALAGNHNYDEALAQYNEVLKTSPNNYDALQGKAFVLLWTDHREESRAIFQSLAALRPSDTQNSEALTTIASGDEEAKWVTLRPASGAPAQDWVAYYDQRLAAYPDDSLALKGRAYNLAQLSDTGAAIAAYRKVLEKGPDDVGAKRELAHLLARDRQYDESIRLYREVLAASPDDADSMEGLAREYVWNNQDREALALYQKLIAASPANTGLQMETARLQLRLGDNAGARQSLNTVIAAEPQNREALGQLAKLDLMQGDRDGALKKYDEMLKKDPKDTSALLGKAQIAYNQGDTKQAYTSASEVVSAEPNNFDAVFLLAYIERAQHHKKKSLQLLDRAAAISPNNSEVVALRQQIRGESAVTLHTSATYSREIGPPTQEEAQQGLPNEDLRSYSFGGTLGFSFIPRTDSYVTFSALPVNSPFGPRRDQAGNQVPTGLTGAAVADMFLYRQSTRANDRWTFRGGAGLIRFGPGIDVVRSVVQYSGPSAGTSALGLVGGTYAPTKRFSVDIDASYMPITYTPTTVIIGVMQSKIGGGLNFFLDPKTDLHLDYYYAHLKALQMDDPRRRDDTQGGMVDFNRVVATSNSISLDLGAEAVLFGFAGRDRNNYMGFFNPSFYQRYLLTPRIYGKLFGPVGYDLSGGIGIQKTDTGNPVKLGGRVSPTLTFKVNDHFSFGLGYTYYNTAQALGTLRGNSVRFTTDWRF